MFMRLLPVFAAVILVAQEQPAVKKLARVEGKALNARTGEPLRKVNVTLGPAGMGNATARQITTEADGRFAFEGLEPGSYQVSADRVGFLPQRYNPLGRAGSGGTIALSAGQQLTGIDFKLIPQGVIAGRILDADGDPMQRVQVSVLRVSSLGGRRRAAVQSSGATNDLGEFRIYSLPAGRYYVMAANNSRGGVRQLVRTGSEEYVPTFYPGSTDAEGASLVDLEAGQEVSGILFQLRRSPVFHVRGKVAGLQPVNSHRGLNVMLMPADRTVLQMAPGQSAPVGIKPDGSFELAGVQPGSYQLVLLRWDRRPVTLGRTPVTVSSGHVDGVTLTVADPLSINGVVRMEGTEQQPDLSAIRVSLRPIDPLPIGGVDGGAKPDGTFKLESVSRDSFTVNVTGAENAYIRSVRLGTQDVTGTGLDLSSAAAASTLEITLGTRPGLVEGTVKEGDKPGAGRTVTLLPDPAKPMQPYLIYTVSADQDGAFNLKGVAPGNYRLYAWEEITRELYTDSGFLKKFENDGIKITVKEGATERAELHVLQAGK